MFLWYVYFENYSFTNFQVFLGFYFVCVAVSAAHVVSEFWWSVSFYSHCHFTSISEPDPGNVGALSVSARGTSQALSSSKSTIGSRRPCLSIKTCGTQPTFVRGRALPPLTHVAPEERVVGRQAHQPQLLRRQAPAPRVEPEHNQMSLKKFKRSLWQQSSNQHHCHWNQEARLGGVQRHRHHHQRWLPRQTDQHFCRQYLHQVQVLLPEEARGPPPAINPVT